MRWSEQSKKVIMVKEGENTMQLGEESQFNEQRKNMDLLCYVEIIGRIGVLHVMLAAMLALSAARDRFGRFKVTRLLVAARKEEIPTHPL